MFWLLAYLTLYFNIDDINNRSRTSVTVLLVVVSLLSSVKDDFPKTTYFKYVDLWFFWFVVNIFVIISVHIILENVDIPVSINPNKAQPLMIQPARRGESPKRAPVNDIMRERSIAWDDVEKGWLSMELINTFFKVLLPLSTTVFIIVYFKFTMDKA